jgi:hypothetical protein
MSLHNLTIPITIADHIVGICLNIPLAAYTAYTLWAVKKEQKTNADARKTCAFIQSQTRLYLIFCIFAILASIGGLLDLIEEFK